VRPARWHGRLLNLGNREEGKLRPPGPAGALERNQKKCGSLPKLSEHDQRGSPRLQYCGPYENRLNTSQTALPTRKGAQRRLPKVRRVSPRAPGLRNNKLERPWTRKGRSCRTVRDIGTERGVGAGVLTASSHLKIARPRAEGRSGVGEKRAPLSRAPGERPQAHRRV